MITWQNAKADPTGLVSEASATDQPEGLDFQIVKAQFPDKNRADLGRSLPVLLAHILLESLIPYTIRMCDDIDAGLRPPEILDGAAIIGTISERRFASIIRPDE